VTCLAWPGLAARAESAAGRGLARWPGHAGAAGGTASKRGGGRLQFVVEGDAGLAGQWYRRRPLWWRRNSAEGGAPACGGGGDLHGRQWGESTLALSGERRTKLREEGSSLVTCAEEQTEVAQELTAAKKMEKMGGEGLIAEEAREGLEEMACVA
jgi:hypothetical protein